MKWEELRNLYPHQYVKFEVVESHIEDDKEYVDEVALIKCGDIKLENIKFILENHDVFTGDKGDCYKTFRV